MKNLISIITALFYSVSLYCANVVPQETPVKFEIHYSEKGVKAKNIPEGWSLQKDTFIYLSDELCPVCTLKVVNGKAPKAALAVKLQNEFATFPGSSRDSVAINNNIPVILDMTNASYTQIILDNTSVYFIKNPQAEVELSECSDSLDYNGIYSTGIEFKLRMKAGMIKNFKIDNEALREIGINADTDSVPFIRNSYSIKIALADKEKFENAVKEKGIEEVNIKVSYLTCTDGTNYDREEYKIVKLPIKNRPINKQSFAFDHFTVLELSALIIIVVLIIIVIVLIIAIANLSKQISKDKLPPSEDKQMAQKEIERLTQTSIKLQQEKEALLHAKEALEKELLDATEKCNELQGDIREYEKAEIKQNQKESQYKKDITSLKGEKDRLTVDVKTWKDKCEKQEKATKDATAACEKQKEIAEKEILTSLKKTGIKGENIEEAVDFMKKGQEEKKATQDLISHIQKKLRKDTQVTDKESFNQYYDELVALLKELTDNDEVLKGAKTLTECIQRIVPAAQKVKEEKQECQELLSIVKNKFDLEEGALNTNSLEKELDTRIEQSKLNDLGKLEIINTPYPTVAETIEAIKKQMSEIAGKVEDLYTESEWAYQKDKLPRQLDTAIGKAREQKEKAKDYKESIETSVGSLIKAFPKERTQNLQHVATPQEQLKGLIPEVEKMLEMDERIKNEHTEIYRARYQKILEDISEILEEVKATAKEAVIVSFINETNDELKNNIEETSETNVLNVLGTQLWQDISLQEIFKILSFALCKMAQNSLGWVNRLSILDAYMQTDGIKEWFETRGVETEKIVHANMLARNLLAEFGIQLVTPTLYKELYDATKYHESDRLTINGFIPNYRSLMKAGGDLIIDIYSIGIIQNGQWIATPIVVHEKN